MSDMSEYPGTDPEKPATPPTESAEQPEGAAPDAPGYWEQQAARYPDQPEPTVQLDPQSSWPSGQPPAQPGQPGQPQYPPYGNQPGQPQYPPYGNQPGQPQYPPYAPQGQYPQMGYVPTGRPQHPQAGLALGLGLGALLGGMFCVVPILLSPFAWAIGMRTRREIRESRGALDGDGMAQAGMIMGIIGTVLMALIVFGIAVLAIVLIAGSSTTNV
jgi:hypothetical protein